VIRALPTTLDAEVHLPVLAMLDILSVVELQQLLSVTGRWTKALAQSLKMSPVLGMMPRLSIVRRMPQESLVTD
jgi:hypothetical protein